MVKLLTKSGNFEGRTFSRRFYMKMKLWGLIHLFHQYYMVAPTA